MFLLETNGTATGRSIFEGAEPAEEMEETGEDNCDMGKLDNNCIKLIVIGAILSQLILPIIFSHKYPK